MQLSNIIFPPVEFGKKVFELCPEAEYLFSGITEPRGSHALINWLQSINYLLHTELVEIASLFSNTALLRTRNK